MAANSFNFTKAALLAIPSAPKGMRRTYRDSKTAGLQLRVTASGVKTFSVYRWVKGASKPERVTLSTFPEMSVEKARLAATKINAAIADGQNPSETRRRVKAELNFGELFQLYLDRHAKPHKRTWREDQSKYEQYLVSDNEGVKPPVATSNSPICGRVKFPQARRQEGEDCYSESLPFTRRRAASFRR